jgi:hypothetical protein
MCGENPKQTVQSLNTDEDLPPILRVIVELSSARVAIEGGHA